MLRSMFGMGGSEILVILVIALLFLGPDKLPEVTKAISKGVRDLKKHSRVLQQTIENDENIGGAIRDLKSALRGDEIPVRPPKKKPPLAIVEGDVKPPEAEPGADEHPPDPDPSIAYPELAKKPAVTLPETAGEADPSTPEDHAAPEELAAMIRPATGTVAKGSEPSPSPVKPEHG